MTTPTDQDRAAREIVEAFWSENQWYYLGGHLRNCACSTDAAREMVKKWAYWIDHSDHR